MDYNTAIKAHARDWNVRLFRRLTGKTAIPLDRQYWTLCNLQPPEGSEITQMVDAGLLTPRQFHGVDRDEDLIRRNRFWHPEANWHPGEWQDVIRRPDFAPAMVYLDTTSIGYLEVAETMAKITAEACPKECLLLINVMVMNPRDPMGRRSLTILHALESGAPSVAEGRWRTEVDSFKYCQTGLTQMRTYAFYRER